MCCVYVLLFFVLCTICCQFLCIVRFWLPLRYSLTFIKKIQFYDVQIRTVLQHFFVSKYRIYLCDVYVPITNKLHIFIYYLSCSIINLANNKLYIAFLRTRLMESSTHWGLLSEYAINRKMDMKNARDEHNTTSPTLNKVKCLYLYNLSCYTC